VKGINIRKNMMKHIKSREDFLNEQLFGNMYGQIIDLLGGLSGEIKDPKPSVVNGEVKFTSSGDKGKNIQLLIDTMKKHGITNPYTQIAILGVIGKESGYVPKNEYSYSNTDNSRLRNLFGRRLKRFSDDELNKLKKDDVEFYDVIYGNKQDPKPNWNTGNDQPGDGFKYRGRGFNQITFKSLYEKYQKLFDKYGKLSKNVNIVSNPDQLNDPEVAAEAAVLYFLDAASNKAMGQKYGVSDINGFKDQRTAIKAMTNANAGWGKDIGGSRDLEKAEKYAANFKMDSSGSASLA
jgi:predicted chitinase